MSAADNTPKPKLVKTVAKYLGLLVVFLALAVTAYTWLTLNFSYSPGERAGFLQKLSKKD